MVAIHNGAACFVVAVSYTHLDVYKRQELGSFKFARQKSKLAGTIRGSYFVIKGEY